MFSIINQQNEAPKVQKEDICIFLPISLGLFKTITIPSRKDIFVYAPYQCSIEIIITNLGATQSEN